MVSGGESSSRVRLPAASPHEQELLGLSLQLANEQLSSVQRQAEIQKYLVDQFPDLFRQASDSQALNPQAFAEEIDQLRGSLDQSRHDISVAAENALRLGESDIQAFQQQGIRNVRDVLAPSSGLRPEDTPILRAGSDIVREAERQQGQLVRSVRGAEASALSSLPFERGLATTTLEAELGDRAFQNRLALTGETLGFAGLNPGLNVPQALSVAQIRGLAQPRQRASTFNYEVTSEDIGSIIEAVGFCWVAAEYYGWGTPEWLAARRWISEGWEGTVADLFRKLYSAHGERVAGWVRRSRVVRAALRPLFRWARRRGEAM